MNFLMLDVSIVVLVGVVVLNCIILVFIGIFFKIFIVVGVGIGIILWVYLINFFLIWIGDVIILLIFK